MRIAGMGAYALFQVVESLADGHQLLSVQRAGLLRQVFQPINLPAAAVDECLAFAEGHRVEILREPEHIRRGHKGLPKWSDEMRFRIADHAKTECFSQANSDVFDPRRGRRKKCHRSTSHQSAVTFLRSICVAHATHSDGVAFRFYPLVVEIPDAEVFILSSAKGTCLTGLFFLAIGAFNGSQPLHLVAPTA